MCSRRCLHDHSFSFWHEPSSSVVTSYLTAVGTITTGVWQGTPSRMPISANSSVTVAGQSCVLGSSCAIAAANLSNGTSGTGAVALVNAPTFTGNVTTHANNAASQDYVIIQPGTGGTDYIGALEFANYAGVQSMGDPQGCRQHFPHSGYRQLG